MSRIPSHLQVLLLLITLSLLGSGAAQAHGKPGEHVEEFENHLDDYRQEVEKLSSMVDDIVGDYAADKDTAAGIDAFIAKWEEVGYHLVVETKAAPLYPSIW